MSEQTERYWRVLIIVDELPAETFEPDGDHETAVNDQTVLSRHTHIEYGDASHPVDLMALVFEAGEDAANMATRIIG